MALVAALNSRIPAPHEPTFRARLTLGMTALCVGVLALASAGIYLGTRELMLYSLDSSLLAIARNEIATLVGDPRGEIYMREDIPVPLSLSVGAGYEKLAQVQDSDGRILGQTPNLHGKQPLPPSPPRYAKRDQNGCAWADFTHGGQRFRVVYYPVRDPIGNRYTAIVALLRAPVDRALFLLLATLALAMVLGGGAAAVGAHRLSRELTRPLAAVVKSAKSVRDGDLSSRIPQISHDAELHDVTTVLNEMLERLERSFAAQEQMIAAQRRFLGDASHELRSPMGNLRGAIEVTLRRPRVPAEYREALHSAHAETVRMCRLVDDLLTLSRADAGQFHMDFAPCDLSYIARQAAIAHAAVASEAEVRLFVDATGAKMVCADRDRIRQVLDNLVENALRYAPGGSAIHVTTWQDGECVGFSVQDSGPGLSDGEQAHIFDRFYRTDAARSRHSGGMGLGLAIAGAIVQAHEGVITVKSVVGLGATFTVSLPAMVDADVLDLSSRQSPRGTAPKPRSLSR